MGKEANKSIHNYKIPARDCLLDVSARLTGFGDEKVGCCFSGAPRTVYFYEQPTVKFLRYLMRIYTNTRSFYSKLEFTTSLVEWVKIFHFELSFSSLLGLKSLKFLFMLEKLRFRFGYWTKSVWTDWNLDQRFWKILGRRTKVWGESSQISLLWKLSLQSVVPNSRLSHIMKLYDHRLKSFLSHNVSSLKPQWNAKGIKTLNRNTEMHSRVFSSRLLLSPASAANG